MRTIRFLAALAGLAGCEAPHEPAIKHSLTVSTSGSGTGTLSVSPNEEGFTEGTSVTITGVPAAGSVFTGWTGACAGKPNPCVLVMDGAKVVGGTFVPATGTGRFDGSYSGTWNGGQSSGAVLSGTFTMTGTNGALTGDFAPISGSLRAMSGTVSASGAVTATIAAGTGGCAVTLSGQLSTASQDGVMTATLQGTYSLVQSATCNSNTGTWTATRNR